MSKDKHNFLFFYKVDPSTLRSQIIDTLCYILVILGFIGNLLGLFIFTTSRRTWRISSTYVHLATASSIMNVLCVIRYAFVLHSRLRNLLYDLVGDMWWICTIYEFSFVFRVISSWIALFWMFERLMHVSRRLKTFFRQYNSFKLKIIIPLIIILIVFSCVIAPPLCMYQPVLLEYVNIK